MYGDLKKTGSDKRYTLNLWFIKLRWIAVAISFILIYLADYHFHYLEKGSFWPLIFIVSFLSLINIIYKILLIKRIFFNFLEKIQIFIDLLILSLMLQFSGGIENPLSFIYLLHVILSGILLSKIDCYKVVFIATLFYAMISIGELYGVLPHYTLLIYPHTTEQNIENADLGTETHQHAENESTLVHAAHYPLYVWSMIGFNFFIMLLTAYFITTIMERLRNEERETLEKYQWLQKVLQATGAGLLILNKKLKAEWMNEPIKNWLNIKELDREETDLTISEWVKEKHNVIAQIFIDGIIKTIELDKITESGQKQFFQVTVAPLFGADGDIYQIVELVQDITDKKILEAEMLHSSKMAIVGTMAASIAHEVGNPLSSIATRLMLLENQKDPAFLEKSIPLLQKEIERIKRIVRGISQFGKPAKEVWSVCQINRIISETVEILKYHKTSKKCEIITSLNNSLPPTLASYDQLKQVFLNLGLNAFESMENGGTLTIETDYERGNILIKFTDTGKGINQRLLDQIFNPFFSTKEQSSGLGLFIVYHIVQAHGGEIKAYSKTGKGSTFKIYLPIQQHSK
ncbi:MAG TPA: PAS domain-containing sensor histidine kinase [Ignavibacteria bacterium]|nr:PAS domain-containing sensor histidine kinase [Ignavibacteria bacterium]